MSAFLATLLRFLLTLLAFWFGGKSAGRNAAKAEELKDYVKISKRIDAVAPVSDPHAAGEWLRQRSKRQRDL